MTTEQKNRIKMWVDALRGGEYKQAKHVLRKGDKFCCLGVACDLYRKSTGIGTWVDSAFLDPKNVNEFWGDQFWDEVLPPEDKLQMETEEMTVSVSNWLGIIANPELNDEHDLASVLNDNGMSFSEIADLIEDKYLSEPTDGQAISN